MKTTPNEVRKLLQEVAYGQRHIDGKYYSFSDRYDLTNSLVHQVFSAANFHGWSGEDRMTMLAYHALLAYSKMAGEHLHMLNTTPFTRIIPKQSEG